VLSSVAGEVVEGRLRVVIRGDGRVEAAVARYASGPSPRVLIEVAGARVTARSVTPIARLGVERVRLQTLASQPPTARILIDLSHRQLFSVWQEGEQGRDLVILIGEPRPDRARRPTSEAVDDGPRARAAADDAGSGRGTVDVRPGDDPTPATSAPGHDTGTAPPWTRSVPRSASPGAQAPTPRRAPPAGTARGGTGVLGVQGFRAAVGAGYDRWRTDVRDGAGYAYDNSITSPMVRLQAALWLVDPRILTISALADLRFDRQRYEGDALATDTSNTLENYRVAAVLLSGRGSPLSVYVEESDLTLDQRQAPTATGDPLQLWQSGRQSTRGFAWDLNSGRLPHVSASASVTDRTNLGSFLSGWDSDSREERLDLRADKEHRLLRYDVGYAHDRSRYDYPLATLSTSYSVDVVRGSLYLTPHDGLTLTGGGRMTRFGAGRVDELDRQRSFTGAGGNLGVQWSWSPRWRADAHYSMSTNESDLSLSRSAGPVGSAEADPTAVGIRRRFYYQDYDGRLTYTTAGGATAAAVFVRGLSLDPVEFGLPTLGTLTLAGGQVDVRRTVRGVDLTLGGEAAAGPSASSRGDTAVYHEASGRVQASRRTSHVTLSANAGVRNTGGSYFYPVSGRSWYGGVDASSEASRRFQVRGSASRTYLLRDVVVQRGDDRADALSVGVRGPRFDVATEYADTRSSAKGILETTLIAESDPELLLARRSALFGFLSASRQQRRSFDGRFTVVPGLELFARGRLDRLELPGASGTGLLDQHLAQAGAILGVRQLEVEVGWEYLEYWSEAVSTVDRRFHVRVRRDVLVR
jgi:hypothetical protein